MNPPGEPGFFEVAGRSRLRIRGADAERYLNGQLSIDVPRLRPGVALAACLLTAKGKLCALVHTWRDGDGFLIECEAPLAEPVQARLERYIIADDVSVEPVDMPAVFHILGSSTQPADSLAMSRIGTSGFDTAACPGGLREIPAAERELLRILHGFPAWGSEISEDTLPQEARLETFAVDFDKGCYVGQETVSRLKSVGRVNKRLHGFLGAFKTPPPAGSVLHPPGDPATEAGWITSSARHFGMAQTAALGYVHRQFEDAPLLGVRDGAGTELGFFERREFPIR
jgi:folate-binding protein YgfZ